MNTSTLILLSKKFDELSGSIQTAGTPNLLDILTLLVSALTVLFFYLNIKDTNELVRNEIESRKDAFLKLPTIKIEPYIFNTDNVTVNVDLVFNSKHNDNAQINGIKFNGIALPEINLQPIASTGYIMNHVILDNEGMPYAQRVTLQKLNFEEIAGRLNEIEIFFFDIFKRKHKLYCSFQAIKNTNDNHLDVRIINKKIELAQT